jgi:hypothetical protein
VRWLSPESLSAEILAKVMTEALAAPRTAAAEPPDLGGRDRAAKHLVSVLGTQDTLAQPALIPVNGTALADLTAEPMAEAP